MVYKFSLDEVILLQHALLAFREFVEDETDQEYKDQYSRDRKADINLIDQISNRLVGEEDRGK